MKRILVWGLSNNKAGTEEVISNYVKNCPQYAFDFLCYDYPEIYSNLLHNGINRVFVVSVKIKHPLRFKLELNRFFKKYANQYDAVWFNANDISNIDILKCAKKYGIKNRILHMHNSQIPNRIVTRIFTRINWNKCQQLVTHRWACSAGAGKYIYGDKDFIVVPNFVNAERVSFSGEKRDYIRSRYNIGDALLVGCVGRLADQKNQQYLIELIPALSSHNEKIKLMLIGCGENYLQLKELVQNLSVVDKVIFVEAQDDVQAYYSALDVFVMPSLYEGLSLALLEAQYNGLPCVVSSFITDESVISNSVVFCNLADKSAWVDSILLASRETVKLNERSKLFDIANCASYAQSLFDQIIE